MLNVTIIEAPSVLGQFPGGVEMMPQAVLGAGLAERLGALRAGVVVPPPYDPRIDPATGLLNAAGIGTYTPQLADPVQAVLEDRGFPLVLGGDCSVVLGGLLALRRTGRHGLLFVDGHADFYQPDAVPDGQAAAMDLAFATGRGPAVVTRFEDRRPLVRDDDVVVLGRRDAQEAEEAGSRRIEDTGIRVIDLDRVRRLGVAACVAEALERLGRAELDGFWIHVDVDVLDGTAMPALDYPLGGGGLTLRELGALIAAAVASGRAVGMDVANFNPTLAPGASTARDLVAALVAGLTAGDT